MAKATMVMSAVALMVLLLAACGGDEGVSTEETLSPSTPTATPIPDLITRSMTRALAERTWDCFESSNDYRDQLEESFRADFKRGGYTQAEADYAWDGLTANKTVWTDSSIAGWIRSDTAHRRMMYSAELESLRKHGCK